MSDCVLTWGDLKAAVKSVEVTLGGKKVQVRRATGADRAFLNALDPEPQAPLKVDQIGTQQHRVPDRFNPEFLRKDYAPWNERRQVLTVALAAGLPVPEGSSGGHAGYVPKPAGGVAVKITEADKQWMAAMLEGFSTLVSTADLDAAEVLITASAEDLAKKASSSAEQSSTE